MTVILTDFRPYWGFFNEKRRNNNDNESTQE